MADIFTPLDAVPGPLWFGQKERDFVKQVSSEVIERVLSMQVAYYPISLEHTQFHPLYGEAIQKTFLPPVNVYTLIEWDDQQITTTSYGVDRLTNLTVHFHKRRLIEDQNLFVRVGDFLAYGDNFYEILNTVEPKILWGQVNTKIEISAKCVKARRSLFTAD